MRLRGNFPKESLSLTVLANLSRHYSICPPGSLPPYLVVSVWGVLLTASLPGRPCIWVLVSVFFSDSVWIRSDSLWCRVCVFSWIFVCLFVCLFWCERFHLGRLYISFHVCAPVCFYPCPYYWLLVCVLHWMSSCSLTICMFIRGLRNFLWFCLFFWESVCLPRYIFSYTYDCLAVCELIWVFVMLNGCQWNCVFHVVQYKCSVRV